MTGKKILLVDDSGMARRGARQVLETAGYTVAEAEDGLSALERYFLDKPDLVLLDLVMKGMNGLDVLRKLIVVSADVQDSSRALAESGGAAGFLNKPVNAATLLGTVAQVLESGSSWS
jgi:two-component system, chemotaxis family, chemotaxis protein CheY